MEGSLKKTYSLKSRIFYGFLLAVSDLIFLALSCFISYYIRFFSDAFGKATYSISSSYVIYSIVIIISIIIILLLFRLYDLKHIYKGPIFYPKAILSVFLGTIIVYYLARFISGLYFSRLYVGLLFAFGVILLFISRFIIGVATKRIFKIIGIPYDGLVVGVVDNLKIFKSLKRTRKKVIYGFILGFNDIVFLAIAFFLSYYLRFYIGILGEVAKVYYIDTNYSFYSIVFILSAVLIFSIFRLYNWDQIYRGSGYYSRIIKGIMINIIVIILAGYIFELFTFSRKWIFLLFIFSALLIIISRLIIELITIRLLRKLDIKSRTIIVGVGENANRIEDSFRKYSMEGEAILGYVDKKSKILKNRKYCKEFNILGYIENIREVIYKNEIQRIIVSGPEYNYNEVLEILEKIKGLDVLVMVFPGFFEFSVKRMSMREIAGIPLMQVSNVGFFGFNLFLKNTIDYLVGIIIFIFFIPVYLIIGLAIKFNSPGPVFYQQKRLTKGCKVFYMYKFRSMFVDADKRLAELRKYNEADGPIFKIKKDPRITTVGRFIRRFSIDELPQIINVLRGELSLVGPRPPLSQEVKQYGEWEMKRMNVKQGITGLWQISGRSELSFEEMARLDLYYIQNWSIEMDIKIILKTFPTILLGKGAY
ncbi:MAG: sugar transferase [Candidatus Atribacteria bacterium]|nr:MAG: sugar transferase [Candidatus Atribacteria bacterium]